MKKKTHYGVPEEKKIRYIIHSDARNEADDQFTIAHILMTDKLDVRLAIGGHFNICGDRYAPGQTARASTDEIRKIMRMCGCEKNIPVIEGSAYPIEAAGNTVEYRDRTEGRKDAAECIIREAMKDDGRPLFIGCQGALTDLALAILMEPAICSRMTAIWVGGGCYPDGGEEFNLLQDPAAAQIVFSSRMPLWQIPRSTYQKFSVSLAELEYKVFGRGELGNYLFERILAVNEREKDNPNWPNGETWILGDEGVLIPVLADRENRSLYKEMAAPSILPDLTYKKNPSKRLIRVYTEADERMILEDFFAKLAINFA